MICTYPSDFLKMISKTRNLTNELIHYRNTTLQISRSDIETNDKFRSRYIAMIGRVRLVHGAIIEFHLHAIRVDR